mmetsp:Transcript_15999/g.49578  ORF Transcript_15999/g.49578 Transcript_15999/m.49578 type:complete len:229 (-) Transcript_15999:477-1163(-)
MSAPAVKDHDTPAHSSVASTWHVASFVVTLRKAPTRHESSALGAFAALTGPQSKRKSAAVYGVARGTLATMASCGSSVALPLAMVAERHPATATAQSTVAPQMRTGGASLEYCMVSCPLFSAVAHEAAALRSTQKTRASQRHTAASRVALKKAQSESAVASVGHTICVAYTGRNGCCETHAESTACSITVGTPYRAVSAPCRSWHTRVAANVGKEPLRSGQNRYSLNV